MFATKKLFGRSRTSHRRRNVRRLGTFQSLEDRRMFNVDPHGGPVISHVAIEPIFLGSQWTNDQADYGDARQLDQFLSFLTGSSYMDLLDQYSKPGMAIGHGSEMPSMSLNVSLPPGTVVSDANIQQSLNSWINNGSIGRPYSNELFFFFLPPGVEVTDSGGNSLQDFLGYHSSMTDEYGDHVHYAVIPFPNGQQGAGGLYQQTWVSSHELAEAVTDPDGNAWCLDDPGQNDNGEEIGDLANGQVVYLNNYAVQRLWSNEAGGVVAPAGATATPVAPLQVNGGFTLDETQGVGFNAEVGSFYDPNSSADASAYIVQINWGDGTSSTGTAVAEGNGQFEIFGTHTFQSSGSFAINFTVVQPDESLSGTGTSSASVASPPVVTQPVEITGRIPIQLGPGDYTVDQAMVTFVDPNGNVPMGDYQATINWGDNQSSPGSISSGAGSGQFIVSGDHSYAGPGRYSNTVSISNGSAAPATTGGNITLTSPPVVTPPVVNPPVVTQPVEFTGRIPIHLGPGDYTVDQAMVKFIDPNGNAPNGGYLATIDWGDNQSSAGAISFDAGSGQFVVSGDHTYAAAGTYTITVSVTNGSAAPATTGGSITLTSPPVVTPPVVNPPVVNPPLTNPPAGATPDEQYVTAVYRAVLGRDPSAGELQSWAGQLDAGLSRDDFVNSLDHSAEYFATIIGPAYQQYLGRAADAAGLAYWTGQMQSGLTDEQLEADFIASDEFFRQAGGTDAGWVESLYEHLLGRSADAAGLEWWTGAPARGESRSQVAFGFTDSVERATQRIEEDYLRYLGRPADPAGILYWINQFQHGTTNEDLITGFLAADEYFTKHSDS